MRAALLAIAAPWSRARTLDFLELTKPRVAVLVLFTVAVGALLASGGYPDPLLLVHTLIGTALVAGGASAWNQYLERDTDSRMRRTENRPLPAHRLEPREVAAFGSLLGIGGVFYLAFLTPHVLAALVAGFTFVTYVFVYTPLKRVTTLNTLVGAIPGALPPVIGWSAVRGSIGPEVVALFLVVFLWQVPHFLAIAWIYRHEYARAGLVMLPTVDPDGDVTGRQMIAYCMALVPVSLVPVFLGRTGSLYMWGAAALGLAFLGFAVQFMRCRSTKAARHVLRASLVYLPVLLALLFIDGNSRF